jgi:hypothetical protein
MGNLWNKYSFVIVAIIGIISVSVILKDRQAIFDLQKLKGEIVQELEKPQREIRNYKMLFGINECKIDIPPCASFIVQYRYTVGDQELTAILYKSIGQPSLQQRTCQLIIKKEGNGQWQCGSIETSPGSTMVRKFCDITSFPMIMPEQQELMLRTLPGPATATGFGVITSGKTTTKSGQTIDWKVEVVNPDTKTMDKNINPQH